MAPWMSRPSENDSQVLYLLVDSRHYRRNIRPYKPADDFGDLNSIRQSSNAFSSRRKIVILRAKVFTSKCFPDKSKRSESGSSWRQKGTKKTANGRRSLGSPTVLRPTVLLPPMECTSHRNDPGTTAPVLSARVQENNRLQVSMLAAPSAPSPGEVFYNSEDSSDMAFIVGDEEWRFPAHSFVVGKMERTLNALLENAESPIQLSEQHLEQQPPHTKPSIVLRLPSVQPNVFEQMLRYIYTRQVSLSSVESALQLLQPTHTYHLPELTSLCLSYISKHLSPSNVLKVLAYMLRPSPCSPSIEGRAITESHHDVDNQRNELVLRCFQVLDYNADEILQSDDFETLDYDVVVEILKRDSFEVSSEVLVFDALMKWACCTCKRQRKELTSANKCAVLGDKGLFLVRYLLMTPEEFLRGPHGVLSKDDKEVLLARISGDNTLPLPEHWTEWKLSVKRKCKATLTVSTTSSTDRLSTLSPTSLSSIEVAPNKLSTERKKKPMSKKFLNGVGDLVLCVIQLLD